MEYIGDVDNSIWNGIWVKPNLFIFIFLDIFNFIQTTKINFHSTYFPVAWSIIRTVLRSQPPRIGHAITVLSSIAAISVAAKSATCQGNSDLEEGVIPQRSLTDFSFLSFPAFQSLTAMSVSGCEAPVFLFLNFVWNIFFEQSIYCVDDDEDKHIN